MLRLVLTIVLIGLTNGESGCEHESSLAENNFDNRGDTSLNWQTTYEYTLYNGYLAKLSGWTHTKNYAKGFSTNKANTNPQIIITGLEPDQNYLYKIYQYASSWQTQTGFTAPGANEIFTDQQENVDPTASGSFISDANGEALFQFRRRSAHVHLSAISIAHCADNPCIPNFMDEITDECVCASQTTSCAAGKYCYNDQCRDANCESRETNDIFYGVALHGTWDNSARSMATYLEIPAGVEIQSITWKGSSSTAMQYTKTNAGPWVLDNTSAECKTKFMLTQDQNAFFGAGSKFYMTNSQMKTFIEVDALQAMQETHHGENYSYNRKIVNVLPVVVNLRKVLSLECKFTIGVPEDSEFALFIEAEDNIAEENGQVLITIEVHSRICINSAVNDNEMTNGVKIKAGGENIKSGTTSLFTWKLNDSNEIEETVVNTFCVKTLTLGYTPLDLTTVPQAYDITLEFAQLATTETFDIVATINLVLSDVLGDIEYTGEMEMYRDRALTDKATTYPVGEMFFAKITLSNLVVDAQTITCSSFQIKQTHNDVEELTDMKEDSYLFEEFTPTGSTNTHVCAASLLAPKFHKSTQGLDATLLATVTVEYVQGYQQRRILQINLNNYFKEVDVGVSGEDEMYASLERAPDTKDLDMGFSILDANPAKIVAKMMGKQTFVTENNEQSDMYSKIIIGVGVGLGVMLAYDIFTRRKKAESVPLLGNEE